MSADYYNNRRFEYPRRQPKSTNLFERHAAGVTEPRPYVWPNSEIYFGNGDSTFNTTQRRRRSMDDDINTGKTKPKKEMVNVKPYKDSSLRDDSLTSSQMTGANEPPKSALARAVGDYSEKCSLVGVPFIRDAKTTTVRIIWSCLMIIAIGVMFLHLKFLFANYFSYGKHTKITLGFSNLKFPAVTICNVNTMRMSKIDNASADLQELIEAVSTDNLKQMLNSWSPEFEERDFFTSAESDEDSSTEKRYSRTQGMKGSGYNGDVDFDDDGDKNGDVQGRRKSGPPQAKLRKSNFFDDMPLNLTVKSPRADVSYFIKENYGDSWESECEKSTFDEVQDQFKEHWVAMNYSLRVQLGHQIEDMLLQCSFDGGQCLMGNFTPIQSASYGNCYTIQYSKWLARGSGPDKGLELIIFLETDEYIPGITTDKGLQLVIHQQGTLAFPDDEGISIAAGTQTVIGLKQIEVTRLGDPYGPCTPPESFLGKYGVMYTRTTCQKVCEQDLIRTKCKCYDEIAQQMNTIMKNSTSGLPPCRNETEMICLETVRRTINGANGTCDCNSPCTEMEFDKTISSRQWPNNDFAKVMVEMICKDNNEACVNLNKGKSNVDLSEEFIKLNIYFEDLNYEQMTEAADYELIQFLSDVGGTIGLYIGLSVLGIFELFHLFADIANLCCCSKGTKVEQVKYG